MLREIKARGSDPVTPVIVREDVKRTAQINYLSSTPQEFPGVSVTNTYVRNYPHGDLAAHVLGYVGEISAAQLKQLQRKGYAPATRSARPGSRAATTRTCAGRRAWRSCASTRSAGRAARS